MLTVHTIDDIRPIYDLIKGKNVAIVGNAPRILEREDGTFIDSHDVVIRFNRGYPRTKPVSLGQKTTILSIFGPTTDINEYQDSRIVVSLGTLWDHEESEIDYFLPYGFLHNPLIKACPSNASSGCIWLCECVNAKAGNIDCFGRDRTTTKSFHHGGADESFCHSFGTEEDYMITVAKQNGIPLNII